MFKTNETQITYKQLNKIDSIIAGVFNRIPEMRQSKLGFLYDTFTDEYVRDIQKEYGKKLTRLYITYASVDEKTRNLIQISTGRGFEYTPEKMTELLDAEDALTEEIENRELTIEKYTIDETELEGLTDYEKKVISGIFEIENSPLVVVSSRDLEKASIGVDLATDEK